MAGNTVVYTPDQGTNREKYLNHIIYQREKMRTLAGNKHPSVFFFPHAPRLLHLSTEKVRVRSVGNGDQSGYSLADKINKNINKKIKDNSVQGKNTIIHLENILKYGEMRFILLKNS